MNASPTYNFIIVNMWQKRKTHHTSEQHRQVTILAYLLLLEAVIMFILGVYHFTLNHGPQLLSLWLSGQSMISGQAFTFDEFIRQLTIYAGQQRLIPALVESATLFLLTILGLSGAIGFFRIWRSAWTQAVFVQGVSLLISLILYFINKPRHIFLLMIYGVFMVFYLHYADVQAVFHTRVQE